MSSQPIVSFLAKAMWTWTSVQAPWLAIHSTLTTAPVVENTEIAAMRSADAHVLRHDARRFTVLGECSSVQFELQSELGASEGEELHLIASLDGQMKTRVASFDTALWELHQFGVESLQYSPTTQQLRLAVNFSGAVLDVLDSDSWTLVLDLTPVAARLHTASASLARSVGDWERSAEGFHHAGCWDRSEAAFQWEEARDRARIGELQSAERLARTALARDPELVAQICVSPELEGLLPFDDERIDTLCGVELEEDAGC